MHVGKPKETIAILGAFGLGDTLIQMVMVDNLIKAGYDVTLFSKVLQQLAGWFPNRTILPPLPDDVFGAGLATFSKILGTGLPPAFFGPQLKSRWINYQRFFDSRVTMVKNVVHATECIFQLPSVSTETGIQAPSHLQHRRCRSRVAIHPTSAEHQKNWPLDKFLSLAETLDQQRFEVVFIMSEAELAEWKPKIGSRFPVIGFPNLDECAAFVYESGFFIGNDSGGGHLAACLHIPTLSIHGRKGKSRLWRPEWGIVEVISPAFNLIGSRFRQSCWKIFLTVGRVERAFEKLVQRSSVLEKIDENAAG